MAQYALLIVLLILVVALFIVSYVRRKKYNNELGQMREELKIGDKVMTDTGVVGEVVDSYVEEEYKYFVLKSGRGNNVGYFAVHANAIYYVFGKEPKKENMANVKKTKHNAEEQNKGVAETQTKVDNVESEPKDNSTQTTDQTNKIEKPAASTKTKSKKNKK